MLHRIFPQENSTLTALAGISQQVAEAANILSEMVGSQEDHYPDLLDRILTHESTTTDLLAATMTTVRSSFSTPIPREDIYSLSISLNTAVEKLTSAAHVLYLNKIIRFSPRAATLLDLIQRQANLTTAVLPRLNELRGLDDYWVDMLRLTKQATRIAEEYDADILARYPHNRYLQTAPFIHKLLEANQAMRTIATDIGRIIVQES